MDAAALLLRALDPAGFVPVLARVGGIVSFFPLLGAEAVPARFRIFLAAALAWVLRPFVPAPPTVPGAGVGTLVARIAGELLVGAAIGFTAQVALAAFEAAGQFVGFQMGLTLSGVIDPENGEQVSALTVFYRLVAIVLWFALDGHHLFLRTLVESYGWIGPLAPLPTADFASTAARVSAGLFLLALRIAAPALVVAFLLDVALLLAARALPQVNLLILGYPMKIAMGLFAVAAGLVVLPRLASGSLSTAFEQARRLAVGLAVSP